MSNYIFLRIPQREVLQQIPHLVFLLLFIFCLTYHSRAVAEESNTVSEEPVADTSDWDWSSFEVDDTPLSSQEETQQKIQQVSSGRKTIAEVTAPDFQAAPHQAYKLFEGIPDFEVIPSVKDSEMHPCSNCHQFVKSNLTPRKLDIPHTNFQLKHGLHGKGQFWCFTCHDEKGTVSLKTLDGEILAFEDAYILCSQCHVNQARDWAFGVHGKRVGNWQGKRQVYNCTACHYQHSPAFEPRDALAGPNIRMGIERPAHWVASEHNETSSHEHGHRRSKGHE